MERKRILRDFKLYTTIVILAATTVMAAEWEDSPYDTPGDSEEATRQMLKLEGNYSRHVSNALVDGSEYKAENTMQFVKVSDNAAFMSMHTQFYNGHECNISGIVEYKKVGGFVFQDPDKTTPACLLTVKLNDTNIEMKDPEGNCHKFCGAKGGLNGTQFTLRQKTQIKDFKKIRKSDRYQNATKIYKEEQITAKAEEISKL
jgi:hypothetical protein